jgi:hypothetical protein
MTEWLFWWRRKRLAAGGEPLRIAPPREEAKTEIVPVPAETPAQTKLAVNEPAVVVPAIGALEPAVATPAVAAPIVIQAAVTEPEATTTLVAVPDPVPVTEPLPAEPEPDPPISFTYTETEAEPLSNEERYRYFSPNVYAGFSATSARLVAPDAAFRAIFSRPRPALSAPRTPSVPVPPPRAAQRPQTGIPLARVATATSLPAGSAGNVVCLDPMLFSAYITYPGTIAETLYLTESSLLERGIQLRDRVLRNWQSGGEPFTPEAFTEAGMQIAGHAGTALLICHNVARSFARGGAAIRWENRGRVRGEYFDGGKTWTAALVNRQGLLRPNALAPPSMFYLLFSARAFGVNDPGDWYRYFAIAAIGAYTASRASVMPTAPGPEFAPGAQRLDSIAAAISDSNPGDSPPHRAMLWANTWTFHEWGTWGRTQDTADAAIALAQRAMLAALGAKLPAWQWHIPRPGSLAGRGDGFSADSVSRIVTGAGAAG